MADSKLSKPVYKTIVPDQYKVGNQKKDFNVNSVFFETNKIGKSTLGTAEATSKTLDFIRGLLAG